MKKQFPILVAVLLVILSVACLAEADNETSHPPKTNVEVAAMFAAPDIQPYTQADGNKEMLDSIWIYFTNGTFEQFADVDDSVLLFSAGTYELLNEANFVYDNIDADNGQIIIRREKKLNANGLEDYQSEHTYDLGTLGFSQLYAPNHDRKVAAVFYGCDKQPYVESDGDQEMLDSFVVDADFDAYEKAQEEWPDDGKDFVIKAVSFRGITSEAVLKISVPEHGYSPFCGTCAYDVCAVFPDQSKTANYCWCFSDPAADWATPGHAAGNDQ